MAMESNDVQNIVKVKKFNLYKALVSKLDTVMTLYIDESNELMIVFEMCNTIRSTFKSIDKTIDENSAKLSIFKMVYFPFISSNLKSNLLTERESLNLQMKQINRSLDDKYLAIQYIFDELSNNVNDDASYSYNNSKISKFIWLIDVILNEYNYVHENQMHLINQINKIFTSNNFGEEGNITNLIIKFKASINQVHSLISNLKSLS